MQLLPRRRRSGEPVRPFVRPSTVWLFAALVTTGCASVPIAPLPNDFHWGVAISGFQSEGSFPDSNWGRYIAQKDSGLAPYRDSVDFYRRYREDIALAAAMGVNTFRFSIEWARVMPRRGEVNEEALRYYAALFEALEAHRLTPMVTLLHFVTPGWVVDEGGLGDDRVVEAFAQFVTLVAERFARRSRWWLTINEPSHFLTLERRHGGLPAAEVERAKDRLVKMHRRAYEILKSANAEARVSTNVVWEPAPASWFDDWVFDRVKDRIDYVAVDYYYALHPNLSVLHAARGKYWKVTLTPGALLTALREYHARAPGLPLYVVENGMATDDGLARPSGYTRSRHLEEHVLQLQRARAEGLDVVGYNVWSLTDNYEWGDYRNRFGLYTVDVEGDRTLRRRPTDGVETYQRLIQQRGVAAGSRAGR